MSGLITSHFMDRIVDGIQIVLLGKLCKIGLSLGSAVLGVYSHLQILLRVVGHYLAQKLGKLGR